MRKARDKALTTKIKNIFYESNCIYGARKIRHELRKGGDDVSRKRVRRLMETAGLVPVTWRKSVQTTVSDPKAAPFPNLLRQDFKVALPNLTWVSDFTYVPTDEGWLYLCSFVDLFSRRVVGWETSDTIDRHLAIAAFRKAVENRHPGKRLVIHTDRGCQYTSWDFRREVAAIGGILFGYDTAVISGTTEIVKTQFGLSTGMEGWYVGCALIGSIIGVLVAGMLSDFLGRKKTMLIAALAGAIFSLLLSFSAIKLKADQTIGGTALNLLAPALSLFFIILI